MDLQFRELKDYVDDSIIASDHERLVGELSQMQLHLSDCLLIKDRSKKGDCLEDRCSYVKAGFKKFALFADKLDVAPNSEESIRYLAIKAKFRIVKDKLLNTQEINRVFANLPMFNTYVTTVLLQCDTYRLVKKFQRNNVPQQDREGKFFKDLDPKGNEWKVDEKVMTYLVNSLWAIYQAYKSEAKLIGSGYVKDYRRQRIGRKHRRKLQCRFQMNSHFKEHCDQEYTTEYTSLTEQKAEELCESHLKSAKKVYNQLMWENEEIFKKYIKIDETRNFYSILNRPLLLVKRGNNRGMITVDDTEHIYNVTTPTNENEVEFSQKAEI